MVLLAKAFRHQRIYQKPLDTNRSGFLHCKHSVVCRFGFDFIPKWVDNIRLGLMFGKYVNDGKTLHINIFVLIGATIATLSIALIASGNTTLYLPYVLKYLAYCPLAIIISGAITYIPSNKIVNYFGGYSLEIYLLHEKVLWLIGNIVRVMAPSFYAMKYTSLIIDALSIATAIIGAFILKWICRKICGTKENEKHLPLRSRRER